MVICFPMFTFLKTISNPKKPILDHSQMKEISSHKDFCSNCTLGSQISMCSLVLSRYFTFQINIKENRFLKWFDNSLETYINVNTF